MKLSLLSGVVIASLLAACAEPPTAEPPTVRMPSESARAALSALGVDGVLGQVDGYDLLDATGAPVGQIRFSGSRTSTTYRGAHLETRVAADGVTVDCNGAGASLLGDQTAGLEALGPCRDASRVTSLLIDPASVPPEVKHASNLDDDCGFDMISGCVAGYEDSHGYWYCTQTITCLVDTCHGTYVCGYQNW